MIAACHDELCVRHPVREQIEGFHHQFEAFISPPFAKSEDVLGWIAAPGKIRKLGPARQNSVRAQMHIIAAIFVIQNLAISRHEHGYRVR
jgi:hypothetical protein